MPIHMGVMCEKCHKVHFIATSRNIRPSAFVPGMYRLHCMPPCPEIKEFRKESMYPYRVSNQVFQTGCAEDGEYELGPAELSGKR